MADWEPRSEAQRAALASEADILLFGGAAGSLKSETLMMGALQDADKPWLRALLLRRSFPELERTLIRRSQELFREFGGKYNHVKRRWTFPSGATIEFGYLQNDDDMYKYQGAEFTYIGFDESTHFAEAQIRYMLSRMRSTHAEAKVRMRLASNPGNIGHAAHKALFLKGACFHCHPHLSTAGQIRADAVWPSDQRPVGKSVCFIPGRVTDHTLLSPDYIASLESMAGSFRKALLEGCWEVYEGQYFDNWKPETMVVKRQLIGEKEWWKYWVGIDYGFNGSQAAAYLLAKSAPEPGYPEGRTYVLEEYCAHHQMASEFAREVVERFAVRGRQISAFYLSPDAWSQRGDGHSLADQMMEAAGVGFQQASNDRIGGAMLVYSQLDSGALVIADTCRELVRTMPTRIHDPARPDDVLKISGDPQDDCYDAMRYGVYSFMRAPRPSPEYAIAAMTFHDDPTIGALQRRAALEAIQQRDATKYYLSTWRYRRPTG